MPGNPDFQACERPFSRYSVCKERSARLGQGQDSPRFSISAGSILYWLNALVKKGYVKVQKFRSVQNRPAYAYNLKPSGKALKEEFTLAFLLRKLAEYDSQKRD